MQYPHFLIIFYNNRKLHSLQASLEFTEDEIASFAWRLNVWLLLSRVRTVNSLSGTWSESQHPHLPRKGVDVKISAKILSGPKNVCLDLTNWNLIKLYRCSCCSVCTRRTKHWIRISRLCPYATLPDQFEFPLYHYEARFTWSFKACMHVGDMIRQSLHVSRRLDSDLIAHVFNMHTGQRILLE